MHLCVLVRIVACMPVCIAVRGLGCVSVAALRSEQLVCMRNCSCIRLYARGCAQFCRNLCVRMQLLMHLRVFLCA